MSDDIVKFIRRKDYRLVRELGQGACGRTVLLYDEALDEHFVCKKYLPYAEAERAALFLGFVRETKLLHQVLHPNVVRVFNCFIYPEDQTGYIVMEFVDGQHIDQCVAASPEQAGALFQQTIEGFAYLESMGILHRDIRPANLLVRKDGIVKIIDLGFAKKVLRSDDFGKSISLNWWCAPPAEFAVGRYDFATEVYFVGKLFERIVSENTLEHFPYSALLGQMCVAEPAARTGRFSEVLAAIRQERFAELEFSPTETAAYRAFAAELRNHLSKIESGTAYVEDGELLQRQLEDVYRAHMLEEIAPDAAPILRCFLRGQFYYRAKGFRIQCLRDFVALIKGSRQEKRRILLANLAVTLSAIPRYDKVADDDIPF